MKLVGLISGGKDSVYNMMQCVAAGHEMVAVANIEPEKEEEMDSYMYQSIGHQAVSLVAAALGLPIYRQKSKGRAFCKDKIYAITANDEVEDLFQLLVKVKREMPVEGVSVGAIASDYQRTRVENVCRRLGLKCFAYLWKRNQEELLDEMVLAEVDAIIIKVASAGLSPEHHLGRHIRDLGGFLKELNKKYGVNVCGEGGEYETLTLDCPLYNRMITITDSEDVILSDNAFAPVAFLNVKSAVLSGKYLENSDPINSVAGRRGYVKSVVRSPYSFVQDCVDEVSENIFPQRYKKIYTELPFPFGVDTLRESVEAISEYWKKPGVSKIQSIVSVSSSTTVPLDTTNCQYNYSSGWCCIGNVSGATITDALTCLQKYLELIQFEFQNLVFINIYVKDMSEFANINKVYSLFITDKKPPARVCVGTLLPADTGVLLSAVGHKVMSKSQKVLNSASTAEKENLYVQSISHWAPANIGPYSQCFKVGGLYYLAGQIPLVPGTMEILNKPIFQQCRLSLRHVLRIMEGINENLNFSHVFQAICYVTSEEIAWDISSIWSYVTNNENAPVVAVVVTELPKNAQLEWEVVACSYENPTVISVAETVENYFFKMKRCCFKEPLASSMMAKVSFAKKGNKIPKNAKLDQNGYKAILDHCLQFLRTDKKSVSSSLCMLKVFYRGCDALSSTTLKEIAKSTDFKVVATVIPVSNCEEPDVILTITGIFH